VENQDRGAVPDDRQLSLFAELEPETLGAPCLPAEPESTNAPSEASFVIPTPADRSERVYEPFDLQESVNLAAKALSIERRGPMRARATASNDGNERIKL
jgi:hypothetical protein